MDAPPGLRTPMWNHDLPSTLNALDEIGRWIANVGANDEVAHDLVKQWRGSHSAPMIDNFF